MTTTEISPAVQEILDIQEQLWTNIGLSKHKEISDSAMSRFAEIGLPGKKHESFTYIDTKKINTSSFTAICDNAILTESKIPDSVSAINLHDSEGEYLNILASNLIDETDPFALMNYGFSQNILCFNIPKDTLVDKPIILNINSVNQDGSNNAVFFNRLIIKCEEGSVANFIIKIKNSTCLSSNTIIDFEIGEGAAIEAARFHEGQENTFDFCKLNIRQAAKSHFKTFSNDFGSAMLRNNIEAHLDGEDADTEISAISVLNNDLQTHNYLNIHHHAPHCNSTQRFYNVLMDRARCSIDGTVNVDKGAQQTDSDQLIKTLLLSDDARASTKPNLKIFADDVSCTHGSTCGSLEEEDIFYLTSRGISEEQAREVLTHSFYLGEMKKVFSSDYIEQMKVKLETRLQH
ncbi:MAG: SufD family Fe-S cluster assembly protein [Fibrobacterales bacterium]